MNDEIKWAAYVAHTEKRLDRHRKNMGKSCTACRIGLRWTYDEDVQLFKLLKSPSLMEISEQTDRPVYGILNRMKKYGLVSMDKRGQHMHSYRCYNRSLYEHPELLELLESMGWYYSDLSSKTLMAPSWWLRKPLIIGNYKR